MVLGVFTIPPESEGIRFDASRDGRKDLVLRSFIGDRDNALLRIAADSTRAASFSPLVLVGPTGTGKTLLAEILVDQHQQNHRDTLTHCVIISGADFARGFANALETDALSDFRERFQSCDCLVLDDLTELDGKHSAQLELGRLLDHLQDQMRPVIVTSRTPPSQIGRMHLALASRLSAGLLLPVTCPGADARREILVRLAERHEVSCDTESLDLLARTCEFTVPELNHMIIQLKAESPVITKSTLMAHLDHLAPTQEPSLRTIAGRVCRHLKVKLGDARGSTRRRLIVQARGIAMYLIRNKTSKSLEQIGHYFGGRDHTTVLHACRKIETQLKSDVELQHQIAELEQLL